MEVSNEVKRVELSVRDLVEFAERSGDIDNRTAHTDPDAMQEGARLHRKIQKEQGTGYSAEVTLKFEKQEEYSVARTGKLQIIDSLFTDIQKHIVPVFVVKSVV